MSKKLFTPDTMKDEMHEALQIAMRRASLSDEAKEAVIGCRLNYPDVYMNLAELAYLDVIVRGRNVRSFLIGVRIFMDMKDRNRER